MKEREILKTKQKTDRIYMNRFFFCFVGGKKNHIKTTELHFCFHIQRVKWSEMNIFESHQKKQKKQKKNKAQDATYYSDDTFIFLILSFGLLW